jgi:predicted O-linked N-acetylglucosamine transferase (SPINDLY family)
VQTNYPAWSSPKSETVLKNSEKLRVGYISAYLLSHTVGKLFIGWVENADPSDFEIYCYHTQTKTDSLTRRFRNASFQFRHMTGDIASIAEQIVFDKIQILVFLDIGMSATTQILAALRLAPVQCVAWGHPLTTGLPTVDYFLSSDLMEPDNGQDHYSETLVRIPNLSIFYSRPELPAAVPKRQEFGFKDDDFIFLSTQSLFKHLPADDFIYAHIATLVPNAKFVFIDHESEKVTAIFKQRLETIFCEHNLDAENFCIFQPRLSHTDFLGLNTVCDVLLDPPAWSGGMTSLEGLSCGIPVVTLAGKFMRSRHTYAMLKMMDLCETIAADKRDYIRIAARLGTDRKFYRHCAESIHNNRERLYEDRTVIEALEAFYKGLVNVG